jgi:hypothetical protein
MEMTSKIWSRPIRAEIGPRQGTCKTLPGPFARLGRVTGMEKPGSARRDGTQKVVSAPIPHNALLAGCPFFRSISRLPKAQSSFGKRRPTYPSIKAGHLVRLEMENSDEKPDPCRVRRPEPERRCCSCRLCSQHGRRGLAGHADAALRRGLKRGACRSTAAERSSPATQTNCMKAGSSPAFLLLGP